MGTGIGRGAAVGGGGGTLRVGRGVSLPSAAWIGTGLGRGGFTPPGKTGVGPRPAGCEGPDDIKSSSRSIGFAVAAARAFIGRDVTRRTGAAILGRLRRSTEPKRGPSIEFTCPHFSRQAKVIA